MKISVWSRSLSDSYLRLIAQIGVDCIDFNQGTDFPGVRERGYPDLNEVKKIKNRIRSFGLEINRVTLPDITDKFMKNREGGLDELENTCRALKVFGEAEIPLARQRFAGETVEKGIIHYESMHRGGYVSRGEKLDSSLQQDNLMKEDAEDWWRHFRTVFKELVSIAEDYNMKLGIHPSDPPLLWSPLDTVGFGRVIEEFPSKAVGYIYCCGTRGEFGGQELVLNEIRNYGRKGRIFEVHFRNIRGSLTSQGWFEETLLDEGDMKMFKILQALREVGFNGCLNPDHVPFLVGDDEHVCHGLAYSVGFIKAQLEALEALS
ncbi:MAG: mannonate dehydratase [Candidatus Bathyarchaeia archaeon]